jgi:mono/diheme cytochrome c family protein
MKKNWLLGLIGSSLALAGCGPKIVLAPVADGGTLYTKNCATCHMQDGSGVQNLQPALVGSPVLQGDATIFLRLILRGPDQALAADRDHYGNVMPAFPQFSDAEISALGGWVNQNFGDKTWSIQPAQVAQVRAHP